MIGRPELHEDPRFATMAGRNEHRDELLPVLEEAFRARHGGRLGRGPRRGGRAGLAGQLGRGGARRPADARPRGRRRARPPGARPRALDPHAASARAGRREPGASAGARPVPRRAHRGGARRASAATHPSASASWRAQASSATSRAPSELVPGAVSGRDLVGYGAEPARPPLAGRRAARAQLRAELRGGRRADAARRRPVASEAYLHEVVGAPPTVGRRNLNTESMFEYGSRAGLLARHGIFTAHGLPLTVYAVGQALERNPAAARAMVDAGWEVASHGWRWIDYGELPEEEERGAHARAVEAIERACGSAPGRLVHGPRLGEHAAARRRGGRLPLRLRLVRRRAALLGRGRGQRPPRDPVHARRERLQVPAPERVRHRRRLPRRTSSTRSTRLCARAAGCCRSGSTAGSSAGPGGRRRSTASSSTSRRSDDVWVATRADIARHWRDDAPAAGLAVSRAAIRSALHRCQGGSP